jgi:alpha-L-arabinofuranosidase
VVASPPALSLELFATHDQCESLDVNVQGATFDVAPKGRYLGAKGASLLDVSARLHPDGKTLAVFVVNRDIEKGIQASVQIPGKTFGGTVDLAIVSHDNLMEWNSFDEPERVNIKRSQIAVEKDEVNYLFPAHSISKLTVRLA